MPRLTPLGVLAPLLVLLAACGPRLVRETVHESEQVRVELRHPAERGEVLPRGHTHPALVADVRLAHILASVSHEDAKGRRRPTIRSEHVYELAEGLAKAFEKATPADELAAAAFPRDQRLGIFTDERVTSFRAWMEGEWLVLEFLEIEQALEPNRRTERDEPYAIPTEPSGLGRLRLVPGHAQTARGPGALQIGWRDPYYAKPVSLSVGYGRMRRRTVLMEAEEAGTPPGAEIPGDLDPARMRALDQLEAARRSGLVTEAEYQRRRGLILEGKLEESGYGDSGP